MYIAYIRVRLQGNLCVGSCLGGQLKFRTFTFIEVKKATNPVLRSYSAQGLNIYYKTH